jgi:oligopeptide/dipeptide ABC transporter ATP-binding protein
MPPGCRFAPRCPYRRDVCERAAPAIVALAERHDVGCLRPFGYPEPVSVTP